jgi:tetratricopeptide (TPR) repeat protein
MTRARKNHSLNDCRHRGAAAIILALAAVLPAGAARPDTIELANGDKVTGVEIVAARWDLIQYRIRGQNTSVGGDQVSTIERDSQWLEPARRELRAGQPLKALELLERARGTKPWEQGEVQYLKGKALLLGGKPREAAAAFEEYLKGARESKDWWVPQAIYDLGQSALAQGQAQAAQAHFQELEAFGPSWKLRSTLGLANALLAEKKYLEARTRYDVVVRSREAPLSLKQAAMVGRGRALLGQQQYAQAITEMTDFFFKDPKPGDLVFSEARADATLIVGRAYKAQGGRQNLEQAEIWLLRVPALYRAHGEAHRQAAKELVEVYTAMNRKDRADEWRRRGGEK